jgi:hypothetical protein
MAKEKKQRNKFPLIEVPASGKKGWDKGAWCLVWVYTTNGNFMLKGFMGECEEFIKSQGWKCWAIFNLYHTHSAQNTYYWRRPSGTYRTIIKTFKCDFKIYTPYREPKKNQDNKFKVWPNENGFKVLYLKRLPQQFVDFCFDEDEEYKRREAAKKRKEKQTTTLGDIPGLKELKDKLDGK